MAYSVKEMYYTLQGEGIQAGMPAVFVRFAGCNFWNGRQEDRSSAVCNFCDTDFVGTDGPGGGSFSSAEELLESILGHFPNIEQNRMVVFTGGEPLLQLDDNLIAKLKSADVRISIETNGSIKAPAGIDWIAVSPKSLSQFEQLSGTELKLVFPSTVSPEQVAHLDFDYFLLSPKWVECQKQRQEFLQQAISYCKNNPQWRLSVQQHKYWDIP